MTYEEAVAWADYRAKHGTLHSGQRMDRGFAMLAVIITRALGGKADITDYMPYHQDPEADIHDVMNILKGGK